LAAVLNLWDRVSAWWKGRRERRADAEMGLVTPDQPPVPVLADEGSTRRRTSRSCSRYLLVILEIAGTDILLAIN